MIAPSSRRDMRGSCSSAVLWCQQRTWGVIVGFRQKHLIRQAVTADGGAIPRPKDYPAQSAQSAQYLPHRLSHHADIPRLRRRYLTTDWPDSPCAAVSSPMTLGVRAISVREGSKRKKKNHSAPKLGAAGAWGAIQVKPILVQLPNVLIVGNIASRIKSPLVVFKFPVVPVQ